MENAIVRVPALEEMEVVRLINGPEAFTPDGEFILGPTDVRGFWVAAGFCATGSPGAGGWASSSPSGSSRDAEPRRLAHGLAPLRRRLPQPRVHARPHGRGLLDLLRRQVPGARAPGGPAARLSPAYPRLQRARRAFGEKSGWSARTGSSRTPPPATRRSARAAGPAGTGRRRSAPSTAPAASRRRSSTSPRSRRSRSSARARPGLLERLCDNRVARDVGASPTRRC